LVGNLNGTLISVLFLFYFKKKNKEIFLKIGLEFFFVGKRTQKKTIRKGKTLDGFILFVQFNFYFFL